MDRSAHLAWAKTRAKEYVEAGDLDGALASMASDLMKHPDTADHSALPLQMMLQMGGHLTDAAEVRRWIEGFN